MNENNNRAGVSSPVLESDFTNVGKGKDKAKVFNTPVNVSFYSLRHRLADLDNLSGKAVLDECVNVGILRADTAKEVKDVRHTQEKIPGDQKEKTILTIEEIEDE